MKPVSVRELAELGGRKLVYIRAVIARDVIDDLVDEDGDMEIEIEDDALLYSVHSSTGESASRSSVIVNLLSPPPVSLK